jgi:hypothetical protein
VLDIDLQHDPNSGRGQFKIIAAIVERAGIEKILNHLGLDAQPPPRERGEVGIAATRAAQAACGLSGYTPITWRAQAAPASTRSDYAPWAR